jgi:hypothetical protein
VSALHFNSLPPCGLTSRGFVLVTHGNYKSHLVAWLVDDWPSRQVVRALDPTNFGDRFTVLNLSVL